MSGTFGDLGFNPCSADAEAIACHIKKRFPDLPIILLSAYSEIPK